MKDGDESRGDAFSPAEVCVPVFHPPLPWFLRRVASLVHYWGWLATTALVALLAAAIGAAIDFTLLDVLGDGAAVGEAHVPLTGAIVGLLTALPVGALLRLIDELSRARARLEEEIRRRELAERQLRQLADTDALTGLYNRRSFFARAHELVALAQRYRHPVSLLILDIDAFKRINDEHGHREGDRALAHLATVLRHSLRSTDLAARLGGDEFVVLMPHTDAEAAYRAAQRIHARLRDEVGPGSMTVSIGIATEIAADLEDLLARADRALYTAKRLGRNRICSDPPRPSCVPEDDSHAG